jgi:hypothetical protein
MQRLISTMIAMNENNRGAQPKEKPMQKVRLMNSAMIMHYTARRG